MTAFRLVPYSVSDGPRNMAADETLLLAAERGTPSLRLYGWSAATVSLGYFQPAAVRLDDPRLAPLPWVRRPSGGKTLVHHRELTYALALPAGFATDWMTRMHRRIIVPALESLVSVPFTFVEREPRHLGDVLCFQQHTPGDVLCGGHKVVGSAQRKQHRCLLQHGGILLRRSEHAPELPGIEDLTGTSISMQELAKRVATCLAQETGWTAEESRWTPEEKRLIDDLVATRYASAAWNAKR